MIRILADSSILFNDIQKKNPNGKPIIKIAEPKALKLKA